MIRMLFTLLCVAAIALIIFGMWRGWRARTARDADVAGSARELTGEVIARFGGRQETVGGLQYVSTTPEGDPLSRVAAPGLRYRGPAELAIRRDGVTIEVAGERPVHLAADQVLGTGAAGRRVGKAVEAGGLALLRWRSAAGGRARTLESSFRFANRDEQQRFAAAVAQIAPPDSEQQEGTR